MNIADKNALRGKKEGHGQNNQYAVSHGVCTMIRKEEDVDTKSSIFFKDSTGSKKAVIVIWFTNNLPESQATSSTQLKYNVKKGCF